MPEGAHGFFKVGYHELMFRAHNLVRLGYSHESVMEMDEDEVAEWLDHAKAYNKATGISGG